MDSTGLIIIYSSEFSTINRREVPLNIIILKMINKPRVLWHSMLSYNFFSHMSLVANHTCQSFRNLPCDEGPAVAQFTFSCNNSVTWHPAVDSTAAFAVRRDPLATLSTPLRTDCILCINPAQIPSTEIDQVTHCIRKQMYGELHNIITA